jgi:hypothetical protein
VFQLFCSSPTCPKQFDNPPTTIYYSAEFDPLLALLSPEIAPVLKTHMWRRPESRELYVPSQLGASFLIYREGYMFNAFILILYCLLNNNRHEEDQCFMNPFSQKIYIMKILYRCVLGSERCIDK